MPRKPLINEVNLFCLTCLKEITVDLKKNYIVCDYCKSIMYIYIDKSEDNKRVYYLKQHKKSA